MVSHVNETIALVIRVELVAEPIGLEVETNVLAVALAAVARDDEAILA